ncbi:MAG: TonB-dependent receptor [Hyphomonadaceae bacterium]
MRLLSSARSLSAASLLALGTALAGHAQTNTDDVEEYRLDEVQVTAQRVAENIQDVPISITTLSGDKLANISAGGADIRFLSARVPSVVAESSFGRSFPRFYIRGIGNTDFDLNSTQPVSLVYDDVPYENPILKGYPVFDIAQVEVLRGPQGSLFGRNTPGGIIKFDSVKPSEETSGYGRVAYGRFNTVDVEAAFGTRVADGISFRASGLYQRRDDYVDNAFTGEDDAFEGFEEFAGRLQILAEPTDNTSLLLNVHGRTSDGSARLFRANIIDQGERGLGENFDRDTVSFDGLNDQSLNAYGVNLTANWGITDAIELTYIFGFETADVASRGDIDGGFGASFLGDGNFGPGAIPFPSESAGNVDDLDQFTHELRIAYDNGGPLRAQGGIFVFDEDVQITSESFDSLAPGNPLNGLAIRTQSTDSFGIFGSLTYDVTDQLTLSGGLRWTNDEKDFAAERFISPFGAGPLGPLTASPEDDEISWDVSANYAVNPDINLYSRIARGFRAPSVQGRLVFGDEISVADSETVTSYEAGLKSELLQGRLRYNLSGFFYQLDDQQLTIVGGTTNTVALFNADEGEGYGFEFDIEAAPTKNLTLTAGLSFNKTEIKDDLLIAPGCGAPCTVLDPSVFQSADGTITQVEAADLALFTPAADQEFLGFNISGNAFPNAPEWIFNATARYGIPVQGGEFFVFTDWAYKDDVNFFLYESIEFGEDGFFEGGLRVGYESDRGYKASAYVRNITGTDRLTGGIDFNNLTGFVNEPRIWGIELGYSF